MNIETVEEAKGDGDTQSCLFIRLRYESLSKTL